MLFLAGCIKKGVFPVCRATAAAYIYFIKREKPDLLIAEVAAMTGGKMDLLFLPSLCLTAFLNSWRYIITNNS